MRTYCGLLQRGRIIYLPGTVLLKKLGQSSFFCFNHLKSKLLKNQEICLNLPPLHLASLSKAEREKIPPEFQTYLLTYDEDLSNRTIGGWYIQDGEIMNITKWHIVSEGLRVAASFEVEQKSVGTWNLKNLKFDRAKVLPPR